MYNDKDIEDLVNIHIRKYSGLELPDIHLVWRIQNGQSQLHSLCTTRYALERLLIQLEADPEEYYIYLESRYFTY